MSEPLTDPTALAILDHFRRQPYEPAHLAALRDRLEEIDRQDLRQRLDGFTETWYCAVRLIKREGRRRDFSMWLRNFKAELSSILPV